MINNVSDFFTTRVGAIFELPIHAHCRVQEIFHSIFGVAASALSILTVGRNSTINEYADCFTPTINETLSYTYVSVLRVINPNYKLYSNVIEMGIITEKLARPIFQKARTAAKNESSFLQRHVVSRGAYALGALVATITRTADLALGLLALPLSFITLGTFEKINTFTYKQLLFPVLINDVCVGMRGFVNPQQFNNSIN